MSGNGDLERLEAHLYEANVLVPEFIEELRQLRQVAWRAKAWLKEDDDFLAAEFPQPPGTVELAPLMDRVIEAKKALRLALEPKCP